MVPQAVSHGVLLPYDEEKRLRALGYVSTLRYMRPLLSPPERSAMALYAVHPEIKEALKRQNLRTVPEIIEFYDMMASNWGGDKSVPDGIKAVAVKDFLYYVPAVREQAMAYSRRAGFMSWPMLPGVDQASAITYLNMMAPNHPMVRRIDAARTAFRNGVRFPPAPESVTLSPPMRTGGGGAAVETVFESPPKGSVVVMEESPDTGRFRHSVQPAKDIPIARETPMAAFVDLAR